MSFRIKGKLVDIFQKQIYPAEITIDKERIVSISSLNSVDKADDYFILPGFIDAHVHIESSMLIPSEFARLAVVHGTVATVSDPHEIANVCGIPGIEFMIENGKSVPFKFNFGAPSCVPATFFETAGSEINAEDIDLLLHKQEVLYLAEMMNYPGVLNKDEEVIKKIAYARKHKKPVDGHAPGLKGEYAKRYIDAGISTDHECFSKEEALDKLSHGMKIIIREGSAAKNFDALIDLLNDYPEQIMFCSDDKHPDSLVKGHINTLCARAAKKGIDVYHILMAACVNPVNHYNLKVGLLRKNDFADLILVNDLENFEVIKTYVNGTLVAEKGQSMIGHVNKIKNPINNFNCTIKKESDFIISHSNKDTRMIIEALDGQLITNKIKTNIQSTNLQLNYDIENDLLKIVVVNRYKDAVPSIAYIKNFGLKKGAIASSVAHDSHNIVAIGTNDKSLCKAINLIIENKGGITWVGNEEEEDMVLPLPVGGLMSTEDGYLVAEKYAALDLAAKSAGSKLAAPYMTLSFMALLVIPHLKLSDLGLFDGDRFSLIK